MRVKILTQRYVIIAMLFTTTLILSQILTTVVIKVGPLVLTAADFLFPLAYIFGDIFSEVYGYKGTRLIVIGGLLVQAAFFAVLSFVPSLVELASGSTYLSTVVTPDMLAALEKLFNFTLRISIASLIAYFVGENINSIILSKMKIWTKGRFLPARTIASTLFGQLADSLLFAFIAFYGVLAVKDIFAYSLTITFFKSFVEAVMTPVTVFVCNWLKRSEGIDIYDFGVVYNPLNTDVVYSEENNLWQGGEATN